MSETEKILEKCNGCGLCVEECDFLQKYCTSPRELAVKFKTDGFVDAPAIPYSCFKCSLCQVRCPEGLDVGKMSLEMRREMVRRGTGPLPQHAPVMKAQAFLVSDAFKAFIPAQGKTERVFFPGCSLTMYSPELVVRTYKYLQEKLPGTGIVLGCCGVLAANAGNEVAFNQIADANASGIKSLGAESVITSCTSCYRYLKQSHPELNPVSLYPILDEVGVPYSNRSAKPYNIHDPCPTRFEPEIQASVRSIIKKAGYAIREIPHNKSEAYCCGKGGCVSVVDPELIKLSARRTLDEADGDIVTYCGNCRENLQMMGGHAVHLLDLLFNPDVEKAASQPAKPTEAGIKNVVTLKKMLT